MDPDRSRRVSIPFIAGQWSLLTTRRAPGHARRVSIPFIAGQWSLRARAAPGRRRRGRLNPLHCGAVVASGIGVTVARSGRWSQSPSLRGSGRFDDPVGEESPAEPGLNPLHCGAVVASSAPRRRPRRGGKSQSPSLRGSGRFTPGRRPGRPNDWLSQSPSLRGSGRLPKGGGARREKMDVSIPFIAGQWSLARRTRRGRNRRRVSIPFIAGQWSLEEEDEVSHITTTVSIPFIAGQWSLTGTPTGRRSMRQCFNPLHCGAVVA